MTAPARPFDSEAREGLGADLGELCHTWSGGRHARDGGPVIERHDPSNGHPIGRVPVAGAGEVGEALRAAHAARHDWAGLDAEERGSLVEEAARRLVQHADELARWNSAEMGKPLGDALGRVHAAIDTARQYSQLGPLHRGRSLLGGQDALDLMQHEPRGVAAVIVPWNDPIAIAVQGVAAALVTGNTVVVKPSERAAFSVDAAMRCFDHLPDGVLGVVHGDGHTGRLLAESEVDVVVLTGSVRAGKDVARTVAERGAHAVLELGGNDPLVVDAGVDPSWAAEQAALGSFANAGQICVAVERIYCHHSVIEPFLEALVERCGDWLPADPRTPGSRMGPLVDVEHRDGVHAAVLDACRLGGRVLTGGEVPSGPGAFYPPTVVCDVPEGSSLEREETFGPVAPVIEVGSFDEALARAARGEHGLGATVLTRDMANALSAVRHLDVGTVKVNDVFGGAPGGAAHPRGTSGNALGYGPELLDELTRVKVVHLGVAP